jgi:hypothetical protein
VILLLTGNCSTDEVLSVVRSNGIHLTDFNDDAQRTVLILR